MLDIFRGKGLHELRLDDVRSLLDDTRAEPLHWEAKGVELKAGEVRKQICGHLRLHLTVIDLAPVTEPEPTITVPAAELLSS